MIMKVVYWFRPGSKEGISWSIEKNTLLRRFPVVWPNTVKGRNDQLGLVERMGLVGQFSILFILTLKWL